MRALIIDQCGNRAALPAARALRDDGWTVGIGSPGMHSLAGSSRAVAATHAVPDARANDAELVQAVNVAIAERGYEIVFSLDDVGVVALSGNRDQLDAAFPYGDHDAVVQATDKLEMTRIARRSGLLTPRTETADEATLESFGTGKVIVKPRRTFSDGAIGHVRARIATNPTEARKIASEMRENGGEPLLQEHLAGKLMALTTISGRDSRIVARVQQVAERTWPLDVGISASAHTVEVDRELMDAAERFLQTLGWYGLAQLQFIRGPDGIARLIDFNARFYGSLALSVAAGVNLPAIWARLTVGLPVEGVPEARVGVRYQWFGGDMRACQHEASNWIARLRVGLGVLLRAPRASHSIWSWCDLKPTFVRMASRAVAWTQRR